MTGDERTQRAECDVDDMGLRFEGDAFCRAARFDAIRTMISENRLKQNIVADEYWNPGGPLFFPHSALPADLVDEDDNVTKQKLGEVIEFP